MSAGSLFRTFTDRPNEIRRIGCVRVTDLEVLDKRFLEAGKLEMLIQGELVGQTSIDFAQTSNAKDITK